MPATRKVSVGWQVVFTFIPIVNIWAFYRIRKLTKYFLYVIMPSIAASIIVVGYLSSSSGSLGTSFAYPGYYDIWMVFVDPASIGFVTIVSNLINAAFQAFSVYLVIVWSRKHNRSFEQPAATRNASQ